MRFYNAAGLINDLIKAQQEYQLSRVMAQICKHELIVLDELGFIPFTTTGAQLLFQLCSALYERVAVIVTTNLRFAEWGSIMGGDERMSAALLDRLTHRSTILEFVGTSYRFRQQLQHQNPLGEENDELGATEGGGTLFGLILNLSEPAYLKRKNEMYFSLR